MSSNNPILSIPNTPPTPELQKPINTLSPQISDKDDLKLNSPEVVQAKVVELLQNSFGRAQLGDDPEKLETINNFLKTFPYKEREKKKKSEILWIDMSVRELFQKTIQTMIDIINEVSDIISQRNIMSSVDFRRNIFEAFTKPERRTYVGIWMIFLSFVLYFIDSAT